MLKIQPLTGRQNRTQFDSGSALLDRWLRETAIQHQEKNLSKTFVAIADSDPERILGFYALTVCEVRSDELPKSLAKRLPRTVPGVRLGRLAVDRSIQGQCLGELLLMDAVERARNVTAQVGIHALFVDAKDENAAAFYHHFGFQPFPDQALTLVLKL
jgi:GNAT superfamily N-acetyltransferase